MQMRRLAVLAVLALAGALATPPDQLPSLPDAVSMLETRARLMRMLAMDNASVTAASPAPAPRGYDSKRGPRPLMNRMKLRKNLT